MQVFCNDELIGFVSMSPARGTNILEIPYMEMNDFCANPASLRGDQDDIKTVILRITPRNANFVIRDEQLAHDQGRNEIRVDLFKKMHKIPNDAETSLIQTHEDMSRQMRFRWQAFEVDQKDTERLFDMDIFEPV